MYIANAVNYIQGLIALACMIRQMTSSCAIVEWNQTRKEEQQHITHSSS